MGNADIDDIFDAFEDYLHAVGTPINDAAVARIEDYLDDIASSGEAPDYDYLKKLSTEVLDIE